MVPRGRAATYYKGPHYGEGYLPHEKRENEDSEPELEDESPTKSNAPGSGGTDTVQAVKAETKTGNDLKKEVTLVVSQSPAE